MYVSSESNFHDKCPLHFHNSSLRSIIAKCVPERPCVMLELQNKDKRSIPLARKTSVLAVFPTPTCAQDSICVMSAPQWTETHSLQLRLKHPSPFFLTHHRHLFYHLRQSTHCLCSFLFKIRGSSVGGHHFHSCISHVRRKTNNVSAPHPEALW